MGLAPLYALAALIFSDFAHSEQSHSNPLTTHRRALRDPSYLPAQIGGIIAAYGLSLVFVAITLLALAKKRRELALAKKRREHLKAGQDEFLFEAQPDFYSPDRLSSELHAPVPNFSHPSPIKTDFSGPNPYIYPSPTSAASAPGVDLAVDQRVVQADREMAQQQLEEMYKHVMEHDEAKHNGTTFEPPHSHALDSMPPKKERYKPASLNLSRGGQEKSHSKAHSFFSALRSPKKKSIKGISISSPIMTPHSSTFPRHDFQEMGPMAPRPYAAAPRSPVSAETPYIGASRPRPSAMPLTPDTSPQSVQSIDERISTQCSDTKPVSQAPTDSDPASATSEHSQVPLGRTPCVPQAPSQTASSSIVTEAGCKLLEAQRSFRCADGRHPAVACL